MTGIAAGQGHVYAQNNLGAMYGKGEGVLKDAVFAHMWYNISGANGAEDARKNCDDTEKHMTQEQIAEATERAKVCMSSGYQDCD